MARRLVRDALLLSPNIEGRLGYLLVDGDRIKTVGAGVPPPLENIDETVDARGLTAIPGLINCHTHASLSLQRGLCDDADLFAWAAHNYPTIRSLTERDFRLGNELACLEMAHAGITTVVECCRYQPALFAEAAVSVGLRSYTGGLAVGRLMGRDVEPNWPSLIAEIERALMRFGDHPLCRFFLGAHSTYNCPPALLREVRQAAEALGIGLGVHLAETRQEDALIRERYGQSPTEYLDSNGWLGPRTLAAHVVWPGASDVERLAQSGTAIAHCPVSNAKLASGVAPIGALREAGISVGLGTDSVLSNNRLDLFGEMKAAALLQRATTGRADALTAREVFRMATLDGARAIGLAEDLGGLEPGKLADVVLLALQHPLGLTPDRAVSDLVWATGPDAVRHVLVGGDWVVRDGALVRIDERTWRNDIATELRAAGSLA
jgi:5-methylthioadenosine/S-adenosylhomocysteine deaminase